ncbi:hypothetical protein [Arachidicoccus sp.]|jgi:hypothetical protein|uniref:hypothetical protein n=1 Tax=Arachidicoccus sp. TaxID=1872624 RepID=UPI003D1D2DF2
MKSIKLFFRIFFGAIILAPILAWLIWLFSPKRKLVIAIIDKTELNKNGQERISLDWILNYEKFTKTRTKLYNAGDDYYGFDPKKNGRYRLKGLENFTNDQIEQLSEISDATFFTDTYGVYNNEWDGHIKMDERSVKIYGGMSSQDMAYLEKMKARKKLILAEFNDIGSPTSSEIRSQFETLFGVHWTGWVARYFENLDTSQNKEIPRWLIKNYLQQHGNKWPFHKGGIGFVNQNDQIEILGSETDLTNPVPQIRTFKYGQEKFNLPHFIKYSYWLDIMTYNDSINHAISAYEIHTTRKGAKILQQNNIPDKFAAVIMHNQKDYKFYYFCGDFTDNPIKHRSSYFKGIPFISPLFYDVSNPNERKSFFWQYYRPMVTKILDDYYKELHSRNSKKQIIQNQ